MAKEAKPNTAEGYSAAHTETCERVLVTLLGAFGTMKDTVRLVGGLVPRYLTPERDPDVPAHFGTSDVDVVLNLAVLAAGEGYASLSDQLRERGFKRWEDDKGWSKAWRWMLPVSDSQVVLVEFLRGATEDCEPSKIAPLDGEDVAALSVQHAEVVHDWFQTKRIEAETFGGQGISVENVHYADVPAFIILKALALDSRNARKDAGDLIHVMRYAGDLGDVVSMFVDRALSGQHPEAIKACRIALKNRFCDTSANDGYLLLGSVAYAKFLLGDQADEDDLMREQRYASGLVSSFLSGVEKELGPVE